MSPGRIPGQLQRRFVAHFYNQYLYNWLSHISGQPLFENVRTFSFILILCARARDCAQLEFYLAPSIKSQNMFREELTRIGIPRVPVGS